MADPDRVDRRAVTAFPGEVRLRAMTAEDFAILFEQETDPDAAYMAAFTAPDLANREAFMARRAKILADPTTVDRTILADGRVAGSIASFDLFGERAVGYGLGKQYWGQGIATRALAALLEEVTDRPLHARVVTDNRASLRVLEKCGFTICGQDTGFANARGRGVEEYVLVLAATDAGDGTAT